MAKNTVNIVIRYDFKVGDELPYAQAVEALERGEDFTTNCLDFFCSDNLGAMIIRKDGRHIAVEDVLNNTHNHSRKHIRPEHNLRKLFLGGAIYF